MPSTRDGASVGARTLTLWAFLTIAAIGFALTAAGLTMAPDPLIWWGAAIMAFAALVFLFIQFWHTQTSQAPPSAPEPAGPRPVVGRPKKSTSQELNDQAQASVNEAGRTEEGLVEFTVDAPSKAERKPERARPEGAWPETTEDQWRRQRRKKLPPGEFELPPAFKKRKEFTADMPIVRSIFEDEPEEDEEAPVERDGKTRGQCGECGTYLWAPKKRPIRLRCPKCGKVARLTA